jgi:hypothetical protein
MNPMTIALLALAAVLAIAILILTLRNHRRHGQFGCPLGPQAPHTAAWGVACDSKRPSATDSESKSSNCGCRP